MKYETEIYNVYKTYKSYTTYKSLLKKTDKNLVKPIKNCNFALANAIGV